MTGKRNIGKRVRELRERLGISQGALATKLQVSQATVSAVEGDRAILSEGAALSLQTLSGGELSALDYVRPDKRERLKENLRQLQQGAA